LKRSQLGTEFRPVRWLSFELMQEDELETRNKLLNPLYLIQAQEPSLHLPSL